MEDDEKNLMCQPFLPDAAASSACDPVSVEVAIKALCAARHRDNVNDLAFEIIDAYQHAFIKRPHGTMPESADAEAERASGAEMLSLLREFAEFLRLWQPIEMAPKDRFILLWCPEDGSRWIAKWQGGEWFGVDDLGLTRVGHSARDPSHVTGWFLTHWMPLPQPPGAPRSGGEQTAGQGPRSTQKTLQPEVSPKGDGGC